MIRKVNQLPTLLVVVFCVVFPSAAFASWWNPSSWFTSQNNQSANGEQITADNVAIAEKDKQIALLKAELASSTTQALTPTSEPKVVTKTVTVKNTALEANFANLTQQLANVQAQYAICQGQLTSSASVKQKVDNNSEATKVIIAELATLNQIDFEIDNDPTQQTPGLIEVDPVVGTSTLIDVLKNTKKLDGTQLFTNRIGDWYVSIPENTTIPVIQPSTTHSTLHQIVKNYRIQLQSKLQATGNVNLQSDVSL